MKRSWKNYLFDQPCVKQIFTLLLCFVLLASGFPPASAAEENTGNNRTVKAGVFSFDGYHMQDEDGAYTGYGIELLNLISQYSHLNFEFTGYENTWSETQKMLLDGEIDVATSARKSRERTEIYLFSTPISLNNTVLTVRKQNTSIVSGDYTTYDGMTVGLLTGNSQNRFLPDFAAENGFSYRTREYADSRQLSEALQSGDIDAILTSNLRRMENERLLDTIKVDYFYAITRKDDQELMDEINYAINQMNIYEGDWANALYNQYYGTDVFVVNDFTQREQDYIAAVASGEKQITVTAMPDRKPYSYVEDGELKGILPRFFDSLMRMAGLPYQVVVPADRAEYDQLTANNSVDVVMDWHQNIFLKKEYADDGFLTDTYMNTGTALLTREDFAGPISSLAIAEDQKDLPLDYEQFKDADVRYYPAIEDLVQAVLDGETDAAFMRTHSAQYFVNNDGTNSLHFSIVDSDQTTFSMYVPSRSDHELVTILNKCIHQVSDDVLSRLIAEYTASMPENVSFLQYLAAHPEVILQLALVVALAVGVILFLYFRSRWNKKLLQISEQSKRELEEQLAIVNALSRDYFTVYRLDTQDATLRPLKNGGAMSEETDWRSGEAFPYVEALQRYIRDSRSLDEDKEDLLQALSLERVREALSANPEYSGIFRIQADEEIHNFQFNCVAYRVEDHADSCVLLAFRNIDEIVRKEQQQKAALEEALHMAQAASEAKTAFLSSMSHNIRTPMNAIIGFLDLMRDEADNPGMVMEYIQRIDTASQHLLSLINDILDMSKIERGSNTLNIAEINLAEMIDEINLIIRSQTKERDQTFHIAVSHLNYEHLLGDKMRINQILLNLLSNAVKFTPEGGTIEMRVEELPQAVNNYSRVRFTVQDNGFGMSKDYLENIFEPFSREETDSTYSILGTGLGMSITKSLVDLMGGTIQVESELDKGTTFTVELELRIQDESVRESDPQFWSEHNLARMIVADDDEQICKNIVKTMARTGVAVDYATDGETAVQMMRAAREAGQPYDLILLDWQMPTLNGVETTRLIRKNYPDKIPIILLTAYDWGEIETEARELGITHFMPKPFFVSTFKAAVQRVMAKAEKEARPQSDVVRGKHVLIVDDIEINRIILTKILTTLGARCDVAANGQEAVEKFEASRPGEYDMIFMDIQMPVMDGHEATRAIRSSGHPMAGKIPVIAITANAFVDDVREALEAGMDAHLAKPVQVEMLKSTIQQVLESRASA